MNSGILKFTADYLHDGTSFLRQRVLITDTGGVIRDIVPADAAGEDVRVFDGILCPGFVNAHCHLELSHMQGRIPEHTGLVDFLTAVMQDRGRADPDSILQAAEKAEQAMLKNGIVAVGDISNTAGSIPVKQRGNLFYHTLIEAIGFSDARAEKSMEPVIKTYRAFQESGLPASVVPHAPYSVSGTLFRLINDFDRNTVISIHNQECAAEDALYLGKESDFYRLYDTLHLDHGDFRPSGRSSLRSWLPYFSREHPLILVHNTYTPEEDVSFAMASGHTTYWCLCPNANIYIENSLPPAEMLLKKGVQIVLGTDSLSSNHQLSVLEEIKTLQQHFSGLSLETMLGWATLNGARALGRADRFGSFQQNKQPGIVNLHPLLKEADGRVSVTGETRAARVK